MKIITTSVLAGIFSIVLLAGGYWAGGYSKQRAAEDAQAELKFQHNLNQFMVKSEKVRRTRGFEAAHLIMKRIELLPSEDQLEAADAAFEDLKSSSYSDFGEEVNWWTEHAWLESQNQQLESFLDSATDQLSRRRAAQQTMVSVGEQRQALVMLKNLLSDVAPDEDLPSGVRRASNAKN